MVSMGSYPNGMVDFQAYAGPGDRNLRSSEVEGYQPVSRIGEVVMNSFVDAYEFTTLKGSITNEEMSGNAAGGAAPATVEHKPMFHECAASQPDPPAPSRRTTRLTARPVRSQVGHRPAGDDLPGTEEENGAVPPVRGRGDGRPGDRVRCVPARVGGEELLLRGRGAVEERARPG